MIFGLVMAVLVPVVHLSLIEVPEDDRIVDLV